MNTKSAIEKEGPLLLGEDTMFSSLIKRATGFIGKLLQQMI